MALTRADAMHAMHRAIEQFDCEKAARVYAALDRKWLTYSGTPSANEIRSYLYQIREIVIASHRGMRHSAKGAGLVVGYEEEYGDDGFISGYRGFVHMIAVESESHPDGEATE